MLSKEIKLLIHKHKLNQKIDLSELQSEQLKGIVNSLDIYEVKNVRNLLGNYLPIIDIHNIEIFVSSYEANPQEWLATQIVESYLINCNYKKALDFIMAYDLINMKVPRIIDSYISCCKALGRYDEVLLGYDKLEAVCLEIDDAFDKTFHNFHKGLAMVYKGDIDDGLKLMETSMQSGYKCPFAYEQLATIYLKKIINNGSNLSQIDKRYYKGKAEEYLKLLLKISRSLRSFTGIGKWQLWNVYLLQGILNEIKGDKKALEYYRVCQDLLIEGENYLKRLPFPDERINLWAVLGFCSTKLGLKTKAKKYMSQAIAATRKMDQSRSFYSYHHFDYLDNFEFVKMCKQKAR